MHSDRSWLRRTLTGAVLIVGTVAVVTGCSGTHDKRSAASTGERLQTWAAPTFTLTDVYHPQRFDRAVVVCPYATAESIRAQVGFDDPTISNMSTTRDDVQTILLLSEQRVTRRDVAPGNQVDFCTSPTEGDRRIGPTDVLNIGQAQGGQPRRVRFGNHSTTSTPTG